MSDDRLDQLDYYTLLGLTADADVGAVRRAFRAFAVKYHPDRFAAEAPESVERATAIYRRGSEAFEVLGDATARRAYDVGLARGDLRLLEDPEAVMRRQALAARLAGASEAPPPRPSAPPAPAVAAAPRSVAPPATTSARPPAAATSPAPRSVAPPASTSVGPAGSATSPAARSVAPPATTSGWPPASATSPPPAGPGRPASGVSSLRTPQARAFVERARAAEASGDLRGAWRAMKAALEIEPDSTWLDSEFYRIGGRLR